MCAENGRLNLNLVSSSGECKIEQLRWAVQLKALEMFTRAYDRGKK